MDPEQKTYQEICQQEIHLAAIWKILLTASSELGTRHEVSALSITIDELAKGQFPPEISHAQAAELKKSSKPLDWWAQGINLALIGAIFLVDQLALHADPDDQAKILASKHLAVLCNRPDDNYGHGSSTTLLIQGIPPGYISEAGGLAPKIRDLIKSGPDSWYRPLTDEDSVEYIELAAAPLIAAARYVRENGGPILTPGKEAFLERYIAKK